MTIKQTSGCPTSPGKRRYDRERDAIRAVLRATLRAGIPLRVYSCPDCRGWHLTKRPVWHPSYGTKPPAPSPATVAQLVQRRRLDVVSASSVDVRWAGA